MLSSKDEELDKLKGRTTSSPKSSKNSLIEGNIDPMQVKTLGPLDKEQLN
jgi:hypothetical protein